MTMDRRHALKAIALMPVAVAMACTRDELDRAAEHVARLDYPAEPQFFTPEEWRTLNVLVDDIIPADDRSGSATAARVPEFMDFMLTEGSETRRNTMRTGFAWLDEECRGRFGRPYHELEAAERTQMLDTIAWPARATEELAERAAWFNGVRDMTVGGFFSSRVGLADLGFTGGMGVRRWEGSPPPLMQHLGLSYDEWDAKYGRGF